MKLIKCLCLIFGLMLISSPLEAKKRETKKARALRLTKEGYQHSINQRWKECIASYKEASMHYKAAYIYYSLGICFYHDKRYRVAQKYFRKAIKTEFVPLSESQRKKATERIKEAQEKIEHIEKFSALKKSANDAFAKGNYNDAYRLWLKTYELESNAVFLFNAARAAEKLGMLERALTLIKQALAQESRPISGDARKQSKEFKREVEAKILAKQKAEEEARWTNQRVDWKTYAGIGTAAFGGALVVTSLAYFGQTARNQLDNANTNNQAEVDRINQEVERLQGQGKAALFTGLGLSIVGVGLVLYDLSTVERVRRKEPAKAETKLILGVNSAAIEVRF